MSTTMPATAEHNQGTRRFLTLWHLSFVFIAIGLFVSGYLSYIKFANVPMACIADGPFNCNVVQNSVYSELMGVPIAFLGFLVYVILGSLLLLEKHITILQEHGRLIIFGVTLFAWVYSMWLVYLQFFVLEALCPWCLTHEANITVFIVIAGVRLWRDLSADYAVED